MKVLVTGAAGFIGLHTVLRLLTDGHRVVGIDNLNDYYDVTLKHDRLRVCGIDPDKVEYNNSVNSEIYSDYRFIKLDIVDRKALFELFDNNEFDRVCHLAAQAGVRYSLENPYTYVVSNIEGFLNVLEACRQHSTPHMVYASSSSVYGLNDKTPFEEDDRVDTPASLYAVTKRVDELMAQTYGRLYGVSATGLRFFTVYGPWGRPDMAPYIFLKAVLCGESIDVYNNGDMSRDFTYVDDIVEGVVYVLERGCDETTKCRIYNIGNGNPVHLMDFIAEIEGVCGRSATKRLLPMQKGDVYKTYADTTRLAHDFDYRPKIDIHEGVRRFYDWYTAYK